jgi:hypothetical protein
LEQVVIWQSNPVLCLCPLLQEWLANLAVGMDIVLLVEQEVLPGPGVQALVETEILVEHITKYP